MGGAESGTIELVFLREEKLGCASFKALHKVVRNGVHQLDDVAFPEELPAEAVQALHFAPALMRLMGFFANTRREPAAGYRGDQKRKQSYPVLRIRNCEGSHRGQEEIIEREHGHDGNERGNQHSPHCRNC